MDTEQLQEIERLRAFNLSPKQIARKLQLRPAEVTAVIRQLAQQSALEKGATVELATLEECWVNTTVAQHFFPQDSDAAVHDAEDLNAGLAIVTVTRSSGYNRFILCTYLVDYWCLGIKNAIGPRKLNAQKYAQALNHTYAVIDGKRQKITLAQAQAIVFSAQEYATNLGFKPHKDFEKSREHLGTWDASQRIECGKDGQPFYFCGPYDNSKKILDTLTKSVGEGNFHFVSQAF